MYGRENPLRTMMFMIMIFAKLDMGINYPLADESKNDVINSRQ